MTHPDEWSFLRSRLAPRARKAPAFLATRVLAAIERLENQVDTWWSQWRWMSRWTVAASLAAGLASVYFLTQSAPVPLESMLHGQPGTHMAIETVATRWNTPARTTAFIVEEEPWEVD